MEKYFTFEIKNWIYISLSNPFYDTKKLKGVFKPLKCYFRYGRKWYPVLWCSKPFKIQIMSGSVIWKDKYNTPRYERDPYIWIHLFGFNLVWYWRYDKYNLVLCEGYWEQALWYLYYINSDIEKAKETWPWEDFYTKKSTWNDEFLVK